MTAQLCKKDLEDDIPDAYIHFEECGPGFTITDEKVCTGTSLSQEQKAILKKHIEKCEQKIVQHKQMPKLPKFRKRKRV